MMRNQSPALDAPAEVHFCYQTLIDLFDGLFAQAEGTRLVRGHDEPYYLPADCPVGEGAAGVPYAQVVFAHGYFASALHEISHWCIAGRQRRLLRDFGYWYKPDGRSADEQQRFEMAEVKPQAIEWIFSMAAGAPFFFSADNLAAGGEEVSDDSFRRSVLAKVHDYLKTGLPPRALLFAEALAGEFATTRRWLSPEAYQL